MPLFQKSVLNKHLDSLDNKEVEGSYTKFKEYFFDKERQENILNQKEEQFQEGFLRELFVNILGYTINPNPNFNLTTELKNEKDSKKADGAIIEGDKVFAVIELKSTKTTDLSKVENQAFGYKNNQKNCRYVITSNFQKIRFYIDNAIDFLEWDLFNIDLEQFKILHLCFAQDNLLKDIPAKIKKDSVLQEEDITKKLYKEYSAFRKDLFQNICALNPSIDKLTLFKKTQKLLDRFLFLFFAEDRNLLPPNSVTIVLNDWDKLKELDEYKPLYERFKKYFGYINTGFAGKKYEIFAYNGGLFSPDETLDNIKVDDDLLFKSTSALSRYDFNSEVDVNVLGHIFEHSLTEIEEIEKSIVEDVAEIKTSKRKKDGVFYTPKYITKYIVENTVGKLCQEKKEALKLNEEEYISGLRKNVRTKLFDNLTTYKDWLLQITIIDPACGSGAFLNQALDFLIQEHKWISELEAKLFGSSIVFDIESSILENNLFGVDINQESVDIAKLSLWLRTARSGRKLTSLNNNLKCGNSLIDDPAVAGDKAFNWEQEFPQIFKKGGFDVVVGNPPYVFGGNDGIKKEAKSYFKNNFITGDGKVNLFTLFIECSFNILKKSGHFSFIIPNTFLRVTSYDSSRKFFLNNFTFNEIADLGNDIFQGAVTTAIILIAQKKLPNKNSRTKIIKDFTGAFTELKLSDFINSGYVITTSISSEENEVINKIKDASIELGTISDEMIFGVVISKNRDEVVSDEKIEGYKPFLEGKDIEPYAIKNFNKFLNYQPELLHRARTKKVFEVEEKLLVQRITGGQRPIRVAYDNQQFYNKESINNIILNKDSGYRAKYILGLLNSTLINWIYSNLFTNGSTLTVNISKEYLSQIPIAQANADSQIPVEALVNRMIIIKNNLVLLSNQFTNSIIRKFDINRLTKKLEEWYTLDYKEFTKELLKKKVKMGLKEEAEWQEYFETEKAKALEIKNQIYATDREIDQMVYTLYSLTEEEIKIVECT